LPAEGAIAVRRLRRHHLLSAITGMLSALRWNRCPRCAGFRNKKE
jgi:hypothetical protein